MEQFLKLREGFFKDETIREIESLPDGVIVIQVYIRLMALATDNNGILTYHTSQKKEFYRKLSKEIRIVEPDGIKNALKVLKRYGLVEIIEDQTYSGTHIRFPYVAENRGIETNLFRRKGK